MPRTDSLHQLIRSLSKSEKRYFKLFAGMQGGDKKYVRLFDAIDRQEVYDAGKIRAAFEAEKFVRQLSVAKNYLRNLIIKSLRLYHAGGSVRTRLHEMMIDIEILSEKGLRDEARKIAEKAEKVARKFGEPHLEFEALVRKHGLNKRTTMTAEGLGRVAADQRDALERLANLNEYGLLVYEVGRLVSRGNQIRSSEELAELDQLMASPLLQDIEQTGSDRAAMRFHWIHAANHYARGEGADSLRQSMAIIDLIESDRSYLPNHISLYVAAISNVLLIQEQENDSDGFAVTMEKLRRGARQSARRTKRPSRQEARISALLYTHLLLMCVKRRAFDEAIALVPEIDRVLEKQGEAIDDVQRIRLLLHISAIHAVTGDYRSALAYVNRIIFEPATVEGGGLIRMARLLNLVIHFELGNDRNNRFDASP